MRFQHLKEARQPIRMRRPRWAGDQLAVHHDIGKVDWDKGCSGQLHLRRTSRLGVELADPQHTRRCQRLRTVSECGYGLVGLGEVTNYFQYPGIRTQILRGATAWNH